MPLTQGTSISWRWLMEQLPSTIREDAALSHDYLSIAVEFDNDMDITYYWSSELPVGTGYFCPLVNWKDREFHVVARSGEEGLGAWHDERQNLYEDWRYYTGKPAPERIERVWLIANSAFQRAVGRCAYANIRLEQGSESVKIL